MIYFIHASLIAHVCKVPVTSSNCKQGLQVSRGRDWEWETDDYDNGRAGYGNIKECLEFMWANVKWKGGKSGRFRIGNSGKYDLCESGRIVEEGIPGL